MEKLNQQEEEVMIAVWSVGKGFIKDFYNVMPGTKPHYNTFASILKSLERKGYIKSNRSVHLIGYEPVVKEAIYKRKFMTNFVKKYFESSYMNMVAFFTKSKEISVDELKEVIKMIENPKN